MNSIHFEVLNHHTTGDLGDLDDFVMDSGIFGAKKVMWKRDMLASMTVCEIDDVRGLSRRSLRPSKLLCAILTLLQEAIDVCFKGGSSIICSIVTEQRL